MAEFRGGQERDLKQWISSYRCRVCRRSYDRAQVRVAARRDEIWLVSARCSLCRNQQIFCVALRGNGNETILRDVSAAEEAQFAAMAPLTADDVLDMHQFLEDFDGDFKQLFEL